MLVGKIEALTSQLADMKEMLAEHTEALKSLKRRGIGASRRRRPGHTPGACCTAAGNASPMREIDRPRVA
jgi:hypothetical protein